MKLDELIDLLAQPQQDKIVVVDVYGVLKEFEVDTNHTSGKVTLRVRD